MSLSPQIAIVGGGFAGTLLAVQLAAHATNPLRITLYDTGGAFARGVAYGTSNPAHLLNVPAARMGAFADRIDHFHHWLGAQGNPAGPDEFMPRMVYGNYLESLLAQARNTKNITIDTVKAEVTDVAREGDGLTLTLADGTRLPADRLALAPGSLPVHSPRIQRTIAPERYTANVWKPQPGSILTRSHFGGDDSPVLIIGTGLTMIDMVLSLRGKGYAGEIIAVSRHGLLPQPHVLPVPALPRFLTPEAPPRAALALLSAIRRKAKAENWRAVVDSLRADTPALWAALPESERKKLTRVLAYWSTHRHRMPPQSAAMLAREIEAGTLRIVTGHVRHMEAGAHGLNVCVRTPGAPETLIPAAHVLNCAGPTTDIRKAQSPLLANLLQYRLIEPGPLGWGIAAATDGQVKGNASGRIFALGPLLVGERLETIAVPELRAQAETVAQSILSSLHA